MKRTRTARRRRRQGLAAESLEPRQVLSGAQLVITEIMYNPRLTAAEETAGFRRTDFEFVEVENISDQSGSLLGWRLTGDMNFEFGPNVLGSRQQGIICRNRQAFEFRYGTHVPVLGEFGGSISNNSERFTLEDPSGQTVLDFEFDDAWHPATDGDGYSLSIIDSLADASTWQSATGWKPSYLIDGTPGTPDNGGPGADTAPRYLQVTIQSVRSLALRWDAPQSLEGVVGRYNVYRDGAFIGASNNASYADRTIAPASSYQYQVSAVDTQGIEYPPSRPVEVTIEPVGGSPSFDDAVSRGDVVSPTLTELSGLVTSRRNPGLLWAVDDHAGQNTVHAINSQGQFVGGVSLMGIKSVDWEDIAVGPGPQPNLSYIYVGDIGDNDGTRPNVIVYSFAEPSLADMQPEIPTELDRNAYETTVLRYPDGAHDAETLIVDPLSGDLYIVTKDGQNSRVYHATAAALTAGSIVRLQYVADVELTNPAGGDISPDGLEIIIRNEQRALLYTRHAGESLAAALARRGAPVPVVGTPIEPNGEAIAYDAGNGGYYTISEGTNPTLYFFQRVGPLQIGDANGDGRFDSADIVQVFQTGEYEDNAEVNSTWAEGDWNGDGDFDSADFVLAFQAGRYEVDSMASQSSVAVDELFAHSGKDFCL